MKDYTGEQLGIFQVVQFHGRDRSGNSLWQAVCPHCQGLYSGRVEVLRKSISCGCLLPALLSKRAKTHGESKTPEFGVHRMMVRRCTDSRCLEFKNYGGRGIKVCDRWLADVRNFISDMGRRPDKGSELDRINNNGDYEPGNCRWATRLQQANNKRSNVLLSFNGLSLTLRDWSELTGISHQALYLRVRRGMPTGIALSQPMRGAK